MTKEILRDEIINGSLVARFRKTGVDFVCCTNYVEDSEDGSWDTAEFFESLDDAMDVFYNRIRRSRLEDIASLAIDGLLQDDKESALDYLAETIGLTNLEARCLGVEQY